MGTEAEVDDGGEPEENEEEGDEHGRLLWGGRVEKNDYIIFGIDTGRVELRGKGND